MEWIFDTFDGSAIQSSPAIGGDGTVYIASTGGYLYAVTNGILKWKFPDPYGSEFISSPAVAADGTVYIGSEDNCVYAITNGAVKWKVLTGNQVISSPVIAANGAVYIGSKDGYVYSLPGSAELANSAWPLFHHDPGHTGAAPNPSCSVKPTLVAFPNNPSINSGQFSFYASGTPGSSWIISASSNLETWNVIGSVSVDSSGYINYPFSDTNVAGVTNRFYAGQSGYFCSQAIGFINLTLPPGTNLIANQFYQVNDADYPQNTANWLLDFVGNNYLPDGTEILKWNGQGFDTITYNPFLEGWSPNGDITLLPGGAVFITNATELTIPFAGLVLQGLSSNPISAGTNYVSSIVPRAGLITSNLQYNPNNHDKVLLWTGSNYSTNIYTTNSGWSGGEPIIGLGQGFVLVASQTNVWVQSFSACQPGLFVVPSNPLWTDTGLHVNSNDIVTFTYVGGMWNGGTGQETVGPSGETDDLGFDCFLTDTVAPHDSLIAFVGSNIPLSPYCDSNGVNRWGNSNYFPQQPGHGYWELGTTTNFTSTNRAGELWLGFNDDAVDEDIGDNTGAVAGYILITNQ